MKVTIIVAIFGQLVKLLSPEMLRRMLDAGFDAIEDHITESETKVDDALLPLITTFRTALNIPDNDEPVVVE